MKNKILTLMIMLVMIVSTVTPVSAASIKAPGRVKLSSVKTTSQSQIKITWKKVKGAKGYQIQRNHNGRWIEVKKVKKLVLNDSKLTAGTKYSYRVRAYKTYKQTKWYNKKTKKWVSKKPAKKVRGKSKKVTAYKYGKWSSTKSTTTHQAVVNPTPETPKPDHQHNHNIPIYGEVADVENSTVWHCNYCDQVYVTTDKMTKEEQQAIADEETIHSTAARDAFERENYDRLTSDDVYIRVAAQQELAAIPTHTGYYTTETIINGWKRGVIGWKCNCGAKKYTVDSGYWRNEEF